MLLLRAIARLEELESQASTLESQLQELREMNLRSQAQIQQLEREVASRDKTVRQLQDTERDLLKQVAKLQGDRIAALDQMQQYMSRAMVLRTASMPAVPTATMVPQYPPAQGSFIH